MSKAFPAFLPGFPEYPSHGIKTCETRRISISAVEKPQGIEFVTFIKILERGAE